MGLVLLLCPGVELALRAERCELNRCGIGKRTMMGWKSTRRVGGEERKWRASRIPDRLVEAGAVKA